jgi:hypothetical protein
VANATTSREVRRLYARLSNDETVRTVALRDARATNKIIARNFNEKKIRYVDKQIDEG